MCLFFFSSGCAVYVFMILSFFISIGNLCNKGIVFHLVLSYSSFTSIALFLMGCSHYGDYQNSNDSCVTMRYIILYTKMADVKCIHCLKL